jgi:4-hydroxy-4-methyl-2-oxoglutarate aldolase
MAPILSHAADPSGRLRFQPSAAFNVVPCDWEPRFWRPRVLSIGRGSLRPRLKGIAGVLVDGAVRDVGTLAQWNDFAVFTRWITPRGPSSMERGSVNEPVVFGGVTVSPFDLVVADDDGVVFVPHALAQRLLDSCLARVEAEQRWEAALAKGATTLETFTVPAATEA